jgi:hypothetical protein
VFLSSIVELLLWGGLLLSRFVPTFDCSFDLAGYLPGSEFNDWICSHLFLLVGLYLAVLKKEVFEKKLFSRVLSILFYLSLYLLTIGYIYGSLTFDLGRIILDVDSPRLDIVAVPFYGYFPEDEKSQVWFSLLFVYSSYLLLGSVILSSFILFRGILEYHYSLAAVLFSGDLGVSEESDRASINIFVRAERTHTIRLSASARVDDIIALMKERYSDSFALAYGGKPLRAGYSLTDIGIGEGATIDLSICILGGMLGKVTDEKRKVGRPKAVKEGKRTETLTKDIGKEAEREESEDQQEIPDLLNDIDSEVTSDSSSDEEDDEVDEKSTVAITTEVDPDLKLRKEKEKNKRLKEEMKSIRLEMRQVRAYNEMLEKNMKTVKSTKPTIAAIPEFRDVKHHISFSPKKSIYEKKELSTMEKKSTDSANLRPNDDVNNFDVKKEVAIVLGKGEAIDKGKTPKDMKFDLVIYTLDQSFAEWWKKFKYEVMTANLVGKGGQIKYSFKSHMDPVIKDYFRNMELP